MIKSAAEVSRNIIEYWFASLDDAVLLDRQSEPFSTCFARWHGKQPAIDDEIRTRFEPALLAVTQQGAHWDREVADWQQTPLGLLALVVLLDQFPRNMYRDSARMYAHDDLALSVTTLAIREYEERPLSLVQRMFLYVPLMHSENLTIQEAMVARFESLVDLAAQRSPQNKAFFEFALDYARRHRQVVEKVWPLPPPQPHPGQGLDAGRGGIPKNRGIQLLNDYFQKVRRSSCPAASRILEIAGW